MNPDTTQHYYTGNYFSYLFLSLFLVAMPLQFCIPCCLEALTEDALLAWQQPRTHMEHHNLFCPFVGWSGGQLWKHGVMSWALNKVLWFNQDPEPPSSPAAAPPYPYNPNDWLWQADLVLARDWWATTRLANHVPMAQQTQPRHYALISYNIAPLCPLKGAEAGGFCPCHK